MGFVLQVSLQRDQRKAERAARMIDQMSSPICELVSNLSSRPPSPTAATVPTAYSAVVIPRSSEVSRVLIRAMLRRVLFAIMIFPFLARMEGRTLPTVGRLVLPGGGHNFRPIGIRPKDSNSSLWTEPVTFQGLGITHRTLLGIRQGNQRHPHWRKQPTAGTPAAARARRTRVGTVAVGDW